MNPMLPVLFFAAVTSVCFSQGDGVAGPPSPVVGDIVITEIMANPAGVNDNNGEYFEICNVSTHAVQLGGCRFGDIGSGANLSTVVLTVPGSLIAQPGEFVLFIRNLANPGATGSLLGVNLDQTAGAVVNWTVPGQYYQYAACTNALATAFCSGSSNMNFVNSGNGDGVIFGAPGGGPGTYGTILDVAGYLTCPAPYALFSAITTPTNGASYERRDMKAAWQAPGNVALATAAIDALTPVNNKGTLASVNSNDVTQGYLRNTTPAQIGTTCNLHLLAPGHGGQTRFIATSFSNAPATQVSPTLFVDVVVDDLFNFSITPGNGVFNGYSLGTLGVFGEDNSVSISVPNSAYLVGYVVYTQFLILDGSYNVVQISNNLPLTVTP